MSEEDKDEGDSFFVLLGKTFLVTFPFICLCKWIWPTSIPFDIFEFWVWDVGTILCGMLVGIPIFAWGCGVTLLLPHDFDRDETDNAEKHLVLGAITSVIAGVFEELIFRWVLLYSAFIAIQVINFLLFGFLNWIFGWTWTEIPRILSWYIFLPIADIMTLWFFSSFLVNGGWLLGASVLAANAKFRNGHKYLGWLGFINSWYIGLVLFYIMFNYGLVSAILVHFTYDMIIFSVIYMRAVSERANG